METIKVKKIKPNAQMPTRGSAEAAGYDLYACIDKPILVGPHQTVKVGTGLSFELPYCTFGGIFPRSGLATKKGLPTPPWRFPIFRFTTTKRASFTRNIRIALISTFLWRFPRFSKMTCHILK